jgi:hypothetical protein
MKMLRYTLMAMTAMAVADAAQAEWAAKDYSAEYNACLPSCDNNHANEHDRCVSYCKCVTDGMQALFADHEQMTRQVTRQKNNDRTASLQRMADSCNHKQWGSPAWKLKF